MWFFGGEIVVECVAIVVGRQSFVWWLKTCQVFEIYFWILCGRHGRVPFWERRTEVPNNSSFFNKSCGLHSLYSETVLMEERMLPCMNG